MHLITENGRFVDFIMDGDADGLAAYRRAAGVTVTAVVPASILQSEKVWFDIKTGYANADDLARPHMKDGQRLDFMGMLFSWVMARHEQDTPIVMRRDAWEALEFAQPLSVA